MIVVVAVNSAVGSGQDDLANLAVEALETVNNGKAQPLTKATLTITG